LSADWAEWLTKTRFAGLSDAERDEVLRGLAETRDRVLEGARLQGGDDVLDLGAGTGLLTFGAHERIGDGWVYAVDPSVDVLEELLRGAHEAELPGVMYLIGDAEVIPLPDASVNAAVTRSVLMYVDDVGVAAGELFRVLRPGGRLSLYEPINRKGSYVATTVDWSPLGDDLAGRVAEEWEAHASSTPLMRLDDGELAAALADAGFAHVALELETLEERWLGDERSADARLDAIGAAGEPSLRDRWRRAFGAGDVERLVAHLHGHAGETLTFKRPQAWVTATRP
jgi:ubiquinone/menaquinone biosynthesis C-methylase UbiE